MAKRSIPEWQSSLGLIGDLLRECFDESSPGREIPKSVEGKLETITGMFRNVLGIAPPVARKQIDDCFKKFIVLIGLFDSLSIVRGDEGREQYNLIGEQISQIVFKLTFILKNYGLEEDFR